MATAPLPLGRPSASAVIPAVLRLRAAWAAISILVMWLAVIVVALTGPDIVSSDGVGDIGNHTTVPSAVAVAFFASVATVFVAWFGFRDRQD